MITICRTIMVVLLGLFLGGCSVVIFEDGSACPAQTACPVSATPTAEGTSSSGRATDELATDGLPVDEKASSSSQHQGIVSPATSMSPADVATEIDGHLSYFDVDSAALRKTTITGLLFVAEYLKANPATRILIEGHCDERGTRDYNLALGEKRAEAVRVQLVRQGIDRLRIKTKSFGKERPAMLGASPEAWAKNRRTVIRLIAD
jgi:peptidoglycan-associated lipoprotein